MDDTAVFAFLGVLAACLLALMWKPRSHSKLWDMLSEKYQTHRRASRYPVQSQLIQLTDRSKERKISDFRPLENAEFDFGFDDEGLWLVAKGLGTRKTVDGILIPWSDIGFLKHDGERSHIHIYGFEPFEPLFPRDVGVEIESRVRRL